MSAPSPDAALIAAARSGSDMAFSRLVDRHQQAVRSFLRRVCANPADADDMAQETFLSAWTSLSTLNSAGQFRSWLFGIAWRKAKTQARSAARSRVRDQAWQAERADSENPATDMRIAMEQALAQLLPDQRAAVALCLAGDWSHGDAAAILDMPLGTVKSHIKRGRIRLTEILGVGDERP